MSMSDDTKDLGGLLDDMDVGDRLKPASALSLADSFADMKTNFVSEVKGGIDLPKPGDISSIAIPAVKGGFLLSMNLDLDEGILNFVTVPKQEAEDKEEEEEDVEEEEEDEEEDEE